MGRVELLFFHAVLQPLAEQAVLCAVPKQCALGQIGQPGFQRPFRVPLFEDEGISAEQCHKGNIMLPVHAVLCGDIPFSIVPL